MKPSVLRERDILQLSYDLPHRIFATKVYPCRAPNGSSIIIYGHEQGIRVLWYGGRQFKLPKSTGADPKLNGTSKDEPMVIDLDDDEPQTGHATAQTAEFEEGDPEIDSARPYREVLRYIDIPFGTSVTHLAVPNVSGDNGQSSLDSYPSLFSTHVLLTAACADLSIRLVTLPLVPPVPESKELATWDVQALKIFGSNTHQDLISSITLTHTAETLESDEEADQSKSRSRSRDALTTNPAKATGNKWSVLLASTSCTGSGLLLVHQVPLTNKLSKTSPGELFPIQRQYLRCPLSSCSLSFNPSSYPADRHSNLLIAIPSIGCVKVYQVFSSTTGTRGRRGSAATIDSTTSSSRSVRSPTIQQGRFLITLYPGFISSTSSDQCPKRKHVLDASWVLGGRAILALVEDGEWGVWDLEAAGPSSATTTQNLVKGQNNVSGIQGGSLTKFAIKGNMVPPSDVVSNPNLGNTQNLKSRDLMPMTPHTRKARSDGLFQGASSKSTAQIKYGALCNGSVCVTEQPSQTTATSTRSKEESIIISYKDINVFIPSILAYWRAETTGRGSLDASSSLRPSTIPALRLGGEHQHSIAQLPPVASRSTPIGGLFGVTRAGPPDILAATAHRLILLVSPIAEPETDAPNMLSLPTRPLAAASSNDQALLTQGELDVDGMDRILDGMAGNEFSASTMGFLGKKVGFAVNDDDDDGDNDVEMGMGTPTPKIQRGMTTTATARPGNGSTAPKGRRVFS